MSIKIISGGQTGVDRAALDVAMEMGFPRGGWCPPGRMAEDGLIPPEYPLKESERDGYIPRTYQNVRDADGTLILNTGPLTSGTALTAKFAVKLNKPYWLVNLDKGTDHREIASWVREHRIGVLNVAGPRESKAPGVYRRAADLLRLVLESIRLFEPAGREA